MKKRKSLFPTANSLAVMTRTILDRKNLAGYLGQSFDGDRDLYASCGYPITLSYNQLFAKYTRNNISKRIVAAYPNATWRQLPQVYETEDLESNTEFERIWDDLVKNLRIFNYLRRVDILSGIGNYATLLLGFNDGAALDQPVGLARSLLYLRPYSQINSIIERFDSDQNSERYGLPDMYILKTINPSNNSIKEVRVHWSRIIHVAQDLLEDDIYGTPILEAIYNDLQNIEFILGGSAEMHWKLGFPGLSFKADPEFDFGIQEKTDLEDEIKTYVNGLKRYLKVQGVDIQQLSPQGFDPTPLIMTELKFISGTIGIPLRILIGSERGELASTQDTDNWNDRVDERRKSVGENILLRPFIDRLQYAGVLPKIDKVLIKWPDIGSPNAIEKAEIAAKRMQALQAYSNAIGAQDVYPPDKFLENELGLSPEEIQEVNTNLEKMIQGALE